MTFRNVALILLASSLRKGIGFESSFSYTGSAHSEELEPNQQEKDNLAELKKYGENLEKTSEAVEKMYDNLHSQLEKYKEVLSAVVKKAKALVAKAPEVLDK